MPRTVYGLLKAGRSHYIASPGVQTTRSTGRPNACNLCHLDKTLSWTSQNLSSWYGQPAVALEGDDVEVSHILLMLLKGDAGQRALAAVAMGNRDSQAVSGSDWISPFLASSLNDPYDAVRYVIGRSLQSTPGFENYEYDFVAAEEVRKKAAESGISEWKKRRAGLPAQLGPQLLLDSKGEVQMTRMRKIVANRDDTPIELHE